MAEIVITALTRVSLVALFLPFSVYYTVNHLRASQAHAASLGIGQTVAAFMVGAALFIEVFASIGVIFGLADRLSAILLAVFCVFTAIFYKRFWRVDDFAFHPDSYGLGVFWEFWKNIALAAGFFAVGIGSTASEIEVGLQDFVQNPFSSTQPYE